MLSESGVKWLINMALVGGVFLVVLLIGIQYTLNEILKLLKDIRRRQVQQEIFQDKKEN